MITLAAPFLGPVTVSMLPNPSFSDAQGHDVAVNHRRSMDGTSYTYTKTSGKYKLTYSFENISRAKALEIEEFILAFSGEKIRLTNFKNEIWEVVILNVPVTVEVNGVDRCSFTLELLGRQVA